MEKPLFEIYQVLQKLIGLHRQLLEAVRTEKNSLVDADLNAIQSITSVKQALIESIFQAESDRLKLTGLLSVQWKKPYKEMTLPNMILEIQARDPKGAEQLRTAFNALTILIQRILEQNQGNKSLIEKSLEHVHQMKRNILEESAPRSNTYGQSGQRVSGHSGARLISREI